MSRTIFGALRHRYGPPRPSLASIRAAQQAAGTRFPLLSPPERFAKPNGLTVTIVGGGFGGMMAAAFLCQAGFGVTVFEARPDVGGRVASYTTVSEGRIIEAGAELIGANHPMWLSLATGLGLGLAVLTSEDEFTAASLEMPLYLRGRALLPGEAEDLYKDMDRVFKAISGDAASIPDPYRPWDGPQKGWDKNTVADKLRSLGVDPASLLWDALEAELGNNQAIDIELQSYLGLTAAVRGGQLGDDVMAFWTQSEVFRCEAGNQQLARSLRDLLEQVSPGSVRTGTPVERIAIEPGHVTVVTGDGRACQSDYAVLAVPQPAWQSLSISPPVPAGYHITTGPAIKYLAPVSERFWLRSGQAPTSLSDDLGMTWEGTDNQMVVGGQGVELSVFAGGPPALAAMQAPDKQKYFTDKLTRIYPGFSQHALGPGTFMDWPGDPLTRCGYSCPTVGQVTGAAKQLASMYAGRLAFAGEHTVMAMFGYMEGALQSGFFAFSRINAAARQAENE
jgi:monoamine oxidase